MLVDVSTAACVATTPWPMPQSLMVGYFVRACDSDSDCDDNGLPPIHVDTSEMEDIQWFSKAEVREALAANAGSVALPEGGAEERKELNSEHNPPLQLPGASSLARRLIAAWAEGDMAFVR